jgi:hypothetical protein
MRVDTTISCQSVSVFQDHGKDGGVRVLCSQASVRDFADSVGLDIILRLYTDMEILAAMVKRKQAKEIAAGTI